MSNFCLPLPAFLHTSPDTNSICKRNRQTAHQIACKTSTVSRSVNPSPQTRSRIRGRREMMQSTNLECKKARATVLTRRAHWIRRPLPSAPLHCLPPLPSSPTIPARPLIARRGSASRRRRLCNLKEIVHDDCPGVESTSSTQAVTFFSRHVYLYYPSRRCTYFPCGFLGVLLIVASQAPNTLGKYLAWRWGGRALMIS